MKILSVIEIKEMFSNVLAHIKGLRKLGILQDKASYKIRKNFKMTEEEFLKS